MTVDKRTAVGVRARRANIFARLWAAAFVLVVCASGALAQEPRRVESQPRRPAADVSRPAAAVQKDADESFELNIAERRITEQNFFASTAVAAGGEGARGLDLRVGVAVGAERIDVTLRNVRGSVRFRGSLDALRRVLEARRPAEGVAPSPPPRDVP
jgi:hypothetical protein